MPRWRASKRLGASFVLRGLISSQAMQNPMMNVNQVSVNMEFTLYGSNGRRHLRRRTRIRAPMPAPTSQHMALTLVNEQADEVVAHALRGLLHATPGWPAAAKAGAEVAAA